MGDLLKMVVPLIVGGLLLGGGSYLAGRSGGGGAIELFTSKKSTQSTVSNQNTYSSVYSPTVTRNFDVQYNIASDGSSISTKKEQAISPYIAPTVTPIQSVVPTTAQGGGVGTGSGGGIDFLTIALLGGGGFVVYQIFKGDKKK